MACSREFADRVPVDETLSLRVGEVKRFRGRYRRHVIVSRRRFEQVVSDAMDALPEQMLDSVDNVAVLVEDEPSAEQIGDRAGTLLGLYEGIAQTSRSPLWYSGAMPDRVTLFRLPLCAISADEDDLYDHVYETLVHELAHHFGIDDDRLDELGWA